MDHRTLARLPLMNGSLSRLVRQSPTKATSGTTLNDWPVPPLAQMTGLSQRKVKKHFNPSEFERLDDATLQKYATVLLVDLAAIKDFKKGPL